MLEESISVSSEIILQKTVDYDLKHLNNDKQRKLSDLVFYMLLFMCMYNAHHQRAVRMRFVSTCLTFFMIAMPILQTAVAAILEIYKGGDSKTQFVFITIMGAVMALLNGIVTKVIKPDQQVKTHEFIGDEYQKQFLRLQHDLSRPEKLSEIDFNKVMDRTLDWYADMVSSTDALNHDELDEWYKHLRTEFSHHLTPYIYYLVMHLYPEQKHDTKPDTPRSIISLYNLPQYHENG